MKIKKINNSGECLVKLIRDIFQTNSKIPLHEPSFVGNEKKYLIETIDSSMVSSIGKNVENFEKSISDFTKSKYAVATINGTSALHIALILSGVEEDNEVITQSLTFVATANAIQYCKAKPIFVDVDKTTLGLSPHKLEEFIQNYCEIRNDGFCWNKITNRKVKAVLPVHSFGYPTEIIKIKKICDRYNLELVEDAAAALGSIYKNKHLGNFGNISMLSFNGNKIITTGGGGILLINSKYIAKKAKHLTQIAKKSNTLFSDHDEVGYNYRLPNINAALGLAQMEMLEKFIEKKRKLSKLYHERCNHYEFNMYREIQYSKANCWLNILIAKNKKERDFLLKFTNKKNVITRPSWIPMHMLEMNKKFQCNDLKNTNWLFDRIICLPSSVIK